jgi:hypothetical protein
MNRKYRHQGYRDSEREERSRDKPPPRKELTKEERIQRRSMRHAIDREAKEVVRCPNCGRNAQGLGAITPDTTCPNCAAPMHCCRTCRQFDSAARWQCRAEIEAAVENKTKANDCTEYSPRLVLDVTGRRTGSGSGSTGNARSQFEDLFKR